MSDDRMEPEEQFIHGLILSKKTTHLFLTNGIKLTGKLVNQCDHAIFIVSENPDMPDTQMVYKHAISTFQPIAPSNRAHTRR